MSMDEKITIVTFSHVLGKVEEFHCDDYKISSNGNIGYVAAIKNKCYAKIIPWNRVKEIKIKDSKCGD